MSPSTSGAGKVGLGTGREEASAAVERERLIVLRLREAGIDASMPSMSSSEKQAAKNDAEKG